MSANGPRARLERADDGRPSSPHGTRVLSPLMADHREHADRAERELADLEQESQRLGDRIGEARSQWEQRKKDDAVPGAGGDPAAAESGLPPEADEPSGSA